jgi:hypothetical protein
MLDECSSRSNRLNVDVWGSYSLEADPWNALPRRSVLGETTRIRAASKGTKIVAARNVGL